MDSETGDLLLFSPPGSPSPPKSKTRNVSSTPRLPESCVPTQTQLLLDLGDSLPAFDYATPSETPESPAIAVNDGAKAETMKSCLLDLAALDHEFVVASQGSSLSPHEATVTTTATSAVPDSSSADDSDSEDNEDKYRLESAPAAPRKVSEKKRHDAAVFQSFLHNNEDLGGGRREQPAGIDAKNIDAMPAAAIVRKGQSEQILNSPRGYQIELFERAKERNTIVVLDTGSGKTLIAILLLRHVVEQEFERRTAGEARKVAFFIVDKIALVDQQWSALVSNLPYPVAKFFGQEIGHRWNKEFWDEILGKNDVIVCTAAILQKCLAQGFVTISGISLLIFDEAHHAKKNHAYARIIKDYLLPEPNVGKRPRILGMTASPVDGKSNVQTAARELESLLCSEIATVSSGRLTEEFGQRTHGEIKIPFPRLERRTDTDLMRKINSLLEPPSILEKLVKFASSCNSELGPWCTDRFWKLCFTDGQMPSMIARAEGYAQQHRRTILFCKEDQNPVSIVYKVHDIIKKHPLPTLSPDTSHLSHKTLLLVSVLGDYFQNPGDHKCIVFVERRNTAMILSEAFKQLQGHLPYLKPAYLVGYHADQGPLTMSYRDAVLTIHRFRHGEINCLFASSVAEEGLDIPDCNIVIRFDLCNSMIQYIQSRGRARHKNSKYITLYEKDNWEHTKKLAQASHDAALLRKFCCTLPRGRRLDSDQEYRQIMHDYSAQPSCSVKSSGAKLTFTDSLQVLSAFVSSLQERGRANLVPEYVVMNSGKEYVAQVILPDKSPIQAKLGTPQPSKHAAKCSAAFELCQDLIREKYIDDHLQPVLKKKLPAMRNARLAISSNKKAQYNMLLKPVIWSRVGPLERLYCTALTLENPAVMDRATCPLLLLTREPLPSLPAVPLFFGGGNNSLVRQTQLSGALGVGKDKKEGPKVLEDLCVFTLRVFRDVFSKLFEATADELPYFLVPSCKGHEFDFSQADPRGIIDWDAIKAVVDNETLELGTEDPDTFYKDRFVTDPWDGGRKLYSVRVRTDLKPSDPVPKGVPEPRYRGWKSLEHNICEYSVSIWSRTRASRVWKDDQPVVEAELVSLRRNLLDDFDEGQEADKTCFVIMEPLRVSALSTRVVAMAFAFPAIMHRIDAHLIALDACDMLGLEIRPDLALEAVTKDSDNSGDAREEQINFQAGMGNNYERLEFLGDSFLKMATTIALFSQCPDENEFAYHVERMLLICNKNLFNTAVDKGLQEYVRSKSFNRRTWYPSGLKLQKGKAPQQVDGHALSDKSVADVCEALIGAAYLSSSTGGLDGDLAKQPDFEMAIKAVSAVVKNKNHKMQGWADYYATYEKPGWQVASPTATMKEVARLIEEKLGYKFKWPPLLRCAFKHPSYPYEKVPDYQCLEFLGDALLDMVCVDFLFKKFPDADPQWLTEHKMAMVSNQFLGSLCVKLGLHKHLLSVHSDLTRSIESYVEQLTGAELAAEEDDDRGAATERNKRSLWMNLSPPPKCLPDMVEAYIGAVFVDSEYDYNTVYSFFRENIRPYFEDMSLYDSFANRHPVTFLSTKMAKDFACSDWRVLIREDAPDPETAGVGCFTRTEVAAGVLIHGKVFAAARAASGRYAKIAVAKAALEKLERMSIGAFREESGCECGKVDVNSPQVHGTAI